MEYRVDRLYKAVVNNAGGVYRIYFMFFNNPVSGKVVGIGKGIHSGPVWSYYHIGTATEVRHTCSEGTWVVTFYPDCNPTWRLYPKTGSWWTPTISLADEESETHAQKAYREMQEDKYGTSVTPAEYARVEVKRTGEWYRKMMKEDKARGSILMDNPILRSKEVKKKMYLQLIEVIIFNKETKEVDFREDIVAENEDEAYLLAVQKFGKYNPKIHTKAAKCILGFDEFKEK